MILPLFYKQRNKLIITQTCVTAGGRGGGECRPKDPKSNLATKVPCMTGSGKVGVVSSNRDSSV